jgi:hypothetical protein
MNAASPAPSPFRRRFSSSAKTRPVSSGDDGVAPMKARSIRSVETYRLIAHASSSASSQWRPLSSLTPLIPAETSRNPAPLPSATASRRSIFLPVLGELEPCFGRSTTGSLSAERTSGFASLIYPVCNLEKTIAMGEKTKSVWMETPPPPDAPRLVETLMYDTVIDGAGIIGLSTAYELSAAGQEVVVLDRGPIAGG